MPDTTLAHEASPTVGTRARSFEVTITRDKKMVFHAFPLSWEDADWMSRSIITRWGEKIVVQELPN